MDHPKLPKRYDPPAVEPHWQQRWDEQRIYRFDPASDGPTFSIDTPPPTVSGALHIGHVFSYTHTDLAARFQRMRGRTVFYPMGWDDNGLPTERRVQSVLKVRCDPRLPYDPDFQPDPDAAETTPVSRRNFLELCARVTARDEEAFQHLWRRLGLSVDWTQTYATIDERSRRVAQMAFLDLVRKDEAYSADAPTMWDVDFQTAVAQAEVEDREILGHEYLLEFGIGGGGSLPIMTTRPELLGACVAVVVHPEDSRHRELVGRTAVTPGYRVRVPIYAHPGADPEKGTGAVMVCTFGDVTDVTWWEELDLPARIVLARDGRIISVPWGQDGWESLDPETARRFHGRIAGLSVAEAKRRMADLLAEPAAAAHAGSGPPLQGDPRPITQTTRFYEKGERPLEILLTRQWFIRLLDKREALREQGRKVKWHPESMRVRYERWVEGLKYDWCVSRQRYHGVPVPLWYSLDADGRPAHDQPLLPRTEQLPVEPMTETPPGLEETQRDRPGGFTAETDVLDTWATSSLTPQIVTGWGAGEAMFRRLYPMDLRPQGQEIIRTWAFYTIARAYMLDGSIPWRNVAISGWVVDPDSQKMSKSRGNAVGPEELMDRYGADPIRYWAASARLGTDTAYDEATFKVGKRLVTKLFNAGKLVVGRLRAAGLAPACPALGAVDRPLDRAHLALLADVIREATARMEDYESAAALETVEAWFWSNLCDNYLELTKARAYEGDPSALTAWGLSLSAVLRMFAPFLPHITEEVWSWLHGAGGGSVHRAPWPEAAEVEAEGAEPGVLEAAVEVLTQIRRAKTTARVSLRTPVPQIAVSGAPGELRRLRAALDDVLSAGAVGRARLQESNNAGLRVEVSIPEGG